MFRTDYCGYNFHNPDRDTIYRPEGRDDYLFLHLASKMDFYFPYDTVDLSAYEQESDREVDNKPVYRDGNKLLRVTARPGDCILYSPGSLQYYQAQKRFINSFAHFTCEPSEIQGVQIPLNTIFRPADDEPIIEILRKLQFEYLSKQIRRERMIDLLIRELIITAERSLSLPTSVPEQAVNYSMLTAFRVEMLNNCSDEWTIDKMCSLTNLGRSQFYHYYKTFFYTSPKDDLLAARIDKAKHLLTNQELHIAEVAEQSGFTNIYHFNRYFKRECGMTPGDYRRITKR
ncbi:helix-turn-helix domain-containing protein [Butyrivibrio sp. AE3006]|uniref:helix-turn-helix domain-containing protein n=1 Tax=Butyrivibrio sp. AE3006 TaxID=1280673 RepID=UPI00042A7EEA|nr:AraC family transcriptional regulator [Butyrivibrio sp. AE3006]